MDHYGFEIHKINKLDEIKKTAHYIYNDYDFLYKMNGKENLLVSFHGAVPSDPNKKTKIELPLFRYYNYNINNLSILCLSDMLINKHHVKDNVYLSWYNDTSVINQTQIIIEILRHIKNDYKKIIFAGTSGGAYPALKFASIFNGICLIMNGQYNIEKYPYYNTFKLLMSKIGQHILSKPNIIEEIEKYNSLPKYLYTYVNNDDLPHVIHVNNFYEELKNKNIKLNYIHNTFNFGEKRNISPHEIYMPYEHTMEKVIKFILEV